MKKAIIFIILISISLPLILLMTDVEIAAFNRGFYENKFEEYKITKATGISNKNLMTITDEMLKYLNGEREDLIMFSEVNGITEQVFEEREILHMKDVKDLFSKGYFIRKIMIIIFIISFICIIIFKRKHIGKALIIASAWPLLLMGVLGILMYIDFDKYFTHFHEMFFTNDLWLLDPNTDILIQMLPLEFFSSIAYKIVLYFVVELLLILVIGIILNRKTNMNRA